MLALAVPARSCLQTAWSSVSSPPRPVTVLPELAPSTAPKLSASSSPRHDSPRQRAERSRTLTTDHEPRLPSGQRPTQRRSQSGHSIALCSLLQPALALPLTPRQVLRNALLALAAPSRGYNTSARGVKTRVECHQVAFKTASQLNVPLRFAYLHKFPLRCQRVSCTLAQDRRLSHLRRLALLLRELVAGGSADAPCQLCSAHRHIACTRVTST